MFREEDMTMTIRLYKEKKVRFSSPYTAAEGPSPRPKRQPPAPTYSNEAGREARSKKARANGEMAHAGELGDEIGR